MLKSNIQWEHALPTGNFPITNSLLLKMLESKIDSSRKPKRSELRNAIKINLMTCIKTKRLNGISAKDIKEGFVYVISNPAFGRRYKIGHCLDVRDRLNSYQTYCPDAAFKLEFYIACRDSKLVEDMIKERFVHCKKNGEWFDVSIEALRRFIYKHEIQLEGTTGKAGKRSGFDSSTLRQINAY